MVSTLRKNLTVLNYIYIYLGSQREGDLRVTKSCALVYYRKPVHR